MSIDYFTGTQTEVEVFIAKMDTLMGYPNPATKTTTYTQPQQHHMDRNLWFARVKSVYAPKLGRMIKVRNGPDDTGVDMESVMVGGEKTIRNTRFELEITGAFKLEIS